MTGHGNVIFNDSEVQNLQNYLYSGGFLHIDDNYGMDQYVRKEIKKLFPNTDLIEIPSTHPIFQNPSLSLMDYQKFMSMMGKDHRHLVYLLTIN